MNIDQHDRPADLDAIERSLLNAIATERVDATFGDVGDLTHEIQTHEILTHGIDPSAAALWLEAQVTSRLLDHTARWLRAEHGLGYYTIGSAGHESNAVVAAALRTTDPALLHYRSGGFYVARSMQAGLDSGVAVRDVLRGMLAKSTDQISGGRHKVFGNHALSIIPQTSTIASHLPRAVGLALSFEVAPKAPTAWPSDSIVVCSFGDGSLNHSTAQGAINWAGHSHHSGRRVPVLFVCEDNGIGLSVPTPDDWVAASLAGRAGLAVAAADGSDPVDVWRVTSLLADEIRSTGRPGLLRLSTVRFLGHAGTDVETAYRSAASISSDLQRDPIIGAARLASALGVCSPAETIDWYLDLRQSIRDVVFDVLGEPELLSAGEVMAPMLAGRSTALPSTPLDVSPTGSATTGSATIHTATSDSTTTGSATTGNATTASATTGSVALTLAQTINRMLTELVAESDDVIVFGEDVGRKGGAYGLTRGLQKQFGESRVFDTLLDEQSVLGLALGAALNGRLPIPEIQYLAYLHNAEDQLRGEAASLAFFSQRQYLNPMVVRVAGYGYQKGFGGHFHNDNSIAVLRDIPGLVIASPAHPRDAAGMLRSCVDHARTTGAVCVFLEPIARYHDADLLSGGDGGWTAPFDPTPIALGTARVYQSESKAGPGLAAKSEQQPTAETATNGQSLTIVTWANGVLLSLQARQRLAEVHGVDVRIVDLRWIAPMPIPDMVREANATGRVLVVDETRRSGGVGEGIVAELVAAGFDGKIGRIAAHDSFVPLGAAANLVLVSADDVVHAALDLLG
jgi:2-oxoisovalerate dehydrogenase E1 component